MRNSKKETLDPENWETTRDLAHRMVDEAVDHLEQVRERPVWRPMPDNVRAKFQSGLPEDPTSLDQVYAEYRETVGAYPMGNIHPRFWGWYMGASNFTGALGDFLAAVAVATLGAATLAQPRSNSRSSIGSKRSRDFPRVPAAP